MERTKTEKLYTKEEVAIPDIEKNMDLRQENIDSWNNLKHNFANTSDYVRERVRLYLKRTDDVSVETFSESMETAVHDIGTSIEQILQYQKMMDTLFKLIEIEALREIYRSNKA